MSLTNKPCTHGPGACTGTRVVRGSTHIPLICTHDMGCVCKSNFEFLSSKPAMFCDHANEVPQTCPCKDDCYCKHNTCTSNTLKIKTVEKTLSSQIEDSGDSLWYEYIRERAKALGLDTMLLLANGEPNSILFGVDGVEVFQALSGTTDELCKTSRDFMTGFELGKKHKEKK